MKERKYYFKLKCQVNTVLYSEYIKSKRLNSSIFGYIFSMIKVISSTRLH